MESTRLILKKDGISIIPKEKTLKLAEASKLTLRLLRTEHQSLIMLINKTLISERCLKRGAHSIKRGNEILTIRTTKIQNSARGSRISFQAFRIKKNP